MALPVLHLCRFNFQSQDAVVVGTEISAGPAMSGVEEPIATDGGGYWSYTLNEADFGGPDDDDRAATLAWRSTQAKFSGAGRQVVSFCDRWHQPVNPLYGEGPFTGSAGAAASVLSVINGETGGLNATILNIAINSEKPLLDGERFTYVHSTWLDRCAEIVSSTPISGGFQIQISPPIRGGIAAGDALDFDNPRCVMRRSSQPTNLVAQGLFSSVNSLVLVEDMRQPQS